MAELHDSLVRCLRRQFLSRGLREAKSPMPTYRPDIFAERLSKDGRVMEQIAVEAEISSTLFTEHTSHQLLIMDGFMRLQKAKRIRVRGFLLVPKGKTTRALASSVLDSLFPQGTAIRIVECT